MEELINPLVVPNTNFSTLFSYESPGLYSTFLWEQEAKAILGKQTALFYKLKRCTRTYTIFPFFRNLPSIIKCIFIYNLELLRETTHFILEVESIHCVHIPTIFTSRQFWPIYGLNRFFKVENILNKMFNNLFCWSILTSTAIFFLLIFLVFHGVLVFFLYKS